MVHKLTQVQVHIILNLTNKVLISCTSENKILEKYLTEEFITQELVMPDEEYLNKYAKDRYINKISDEYIKEIFIPSVSEDYNISITYSERDVI